MRRAAFMDGGWLRAGRLLAEAKSLCYVVAAFWREALTKPEKMG
ncbi:MAG: hypothetical protein ACI9NQ_001964 [Paracoccaceae bacterium]|jgi:hypothetical protein